MIRIPTGKGKSSTTLFLVMCGLAALTYQFMKIAAPTGSDLQAYGVAFAAIVSIWVGREWKEAHYGKSE